ncbi:MULTISPECIES: hypothetical protein [unclassified Bradyrhizobium]|uniref:hypothetical protein n=1 Tax=unclassified Bradyrhizobium TaxID=2631580 RepID=UPI0024797BAC|nr:MULTISPECIES: hypothetical protein [unclassified Bradyrhizobium]WGS22484.1 hypothetical protein MTX22_12940 [Bradyrhizobium sp. ISRA463]WGS29459.1 hypothetical protein MTX19_10710 [Bradyrhizobium sp. ISRA464]
MTFDDASQKSRRWATREAIDWAGGYPIEHTATEVDESVLGGEIAGMTSRDFDPNAIEGFSNQVRG